MMQNKLLLTVIKLVFHKGLIIRIIKFLIIFNLPIKININLPLKINIKMKSNNY